ncbi:MAG TPA: DUF2059 domain-containing protein [Candidatus Angelobacter sp.]|nr:DUF2059 domain-containing protein [Candidatus Angelobacter sp.]
MDRTMQNIRPLLIKALPQGEYREKLINLFIEKFRAKVDGQQIINLAVPVYDKHFSHEEIKGLIKFYETPLGQKAISELPRTASELSEAGAQWGDKLGRVCMSEVLAENPDLAEAIKAAGK